MHSELLKRRISSLALAGITAACGSAESTSLSRAAIVGGRETGEAHGEVVYISAEVRQFEGEAVVKIGSGTMVAQNLVATALHVLSTGRSDAPFACDKDGHDRSGGKGSDLGELVAAEHVEIYAGPQPGDEPVARGRLIVSSGSATICRDDIAFVVLDQAVSLPTAPIYHGDPAKLGDTLTIVGFGADGKHGPEVRTERDVQVSAVGQTVHTFSVTEGPCQGDSGGPALSQNGELVGIFSTVSADCKDRAATAQYTDVSYFSTLVEEAFAVASASAPCTSAPCASGGTAGAFSTAGEAGARDEAVESGAHAVGCALGSKPGGDVASSVAAACALLALALGVRVRMRT